MSTNSQKKDNKQQRKYKHRRSDTGFKNRKLRQPRKGRQCNSTANLPGFDALKLPRHDMSRSASLGHKSPRSSLPQINERQDMESHDFRGLITTLSASELDRYKKEYFNADPNNVWQRLLPQCDCYLCNTPKLMSSTSVGFGSLKKRKTPYSLNGSKHKLLLVQQRSFSLRLSRSDMLENIHRNPSKSVSSFIDDDEEQLSHLACICEKDKNLPLIEVMGIGKKNDKHNFMHILNDINSKMIFDNKFDSWFLSGNAKSVPNISSYNKLEAVDDDHATITKTNSFPAEKGKHFKNNSSSGSGSFLMNDMSPREQSTSSQSSIGGISPNYNINDVPILKAKRLRRIQSLHQALRTYHSRLAPPLNFNPKYMIKDDVDDIVDIIKTMTHIIKCFGDEHGMPFQVDLMIIPKATELNGSSSEDTMDDDTDDDDDDIKSDDDYDDIPRKQGSKTNINGNSNKEKRKNKSDNIIEDDIGNMLMKGLKKEHLKDHFYDQCIPLDRSDEGIKSLKTHLRSGGIKSLFTAKKSTQNGRYVIIVDRGGKHTKSFKKNGKPNIDNKKKGKKDEKKEEKKDNDDKDDKQETDYMYFFQPPKPYGDIIDYNTMIEILHLNTLECLLPKIMMKYKRNNDDDDDDEEEEEDEKKEEKEQFIGAKHLCKGEMFCISFHVLSTDEVRCYLYVDQRYMRIDFSIKDGSGYLEDLLRHYIEHQSSDIQQTQRAANSKYNKFAFDTKDTTFDEYFKWVQKHIDKSPSMNRNRNKIKNDGAIEINSVSLHK